MKFFLDTEFIERGREFPVTLISIGIVAEHGETLYLVSSEFNEDDCSAWVRENVLAHLGSYRRGTVASIAEAVRDWVERVRRDEKPEFWGYYADYDWVVTAQMFGTMMDLPKGWPMYCRDLKQWCDQLGNPKLPEQSGTEHNALADAQWNRQAYDFLLARASSPDPAREALVGALKQADFFLSHSGNQRAIISGAYAKPSGRWDEFNKTKDMVRAAIARAEQGHKGGK